MRRRGFILLGLFISISMLMPLRAQEAATALANRVLGNQADNFIFEIDDSLSAPCTGDYFSLIPKGKQIRIAANSENSLAMGLGYYLKHYAHVDLSWHPSMPVELPTSMPRLKEVVTLKAECQTRFFLNYCTYGYSLPWWQWEQWEKFIDWMALNGINMPLALTGQEAVWQQVWREMGMKDDSIRSYFSGPVHLPWHRMANLDGYSGPLPQSWIDGQKKLQKRILKRERELGMTPVLPAFAGHVPQQIKVLYPEADIQPLSPWCGFAPTYFLNSTDTLFARIQQLYLEAQSELYGTDHIYGADPFNEMNPPSWEPQYLASVSRNIYNSMKWVDPEARWLQMGWVFYYKRQQWTPERLKAYLTAVPQGKMILLDYFCENTEVWRSTEGFYGQPFIWCYLGNFGGNTMLVGNLRELSTKLDRAFAEAGPNLVGIGSTLEGFDCTQQIYDFLLEYPWKAKADTTKWTSRRIDEWSLQYADRRSGKANDSVRAAWRLLNNEVYHDWSFYGLGTQMVARPSFDGHGTYYTKPEYSYSNDTLLRAIRLMVSRPSKRQSYQYDLVNLLSQWMGNQFWQVRNSFTEAYKSRNADLMRQAKKVADRMMVDVDLLLSTQPSTSTYEWVCQANGWGRNKKERQQYTEEASRLLTSWGGPILNDYANRLWGGLVADYYQRRWDMFFDAAIRAVEIGDTLHYQQFSKELSTFEQSFCIVFIDRKGEPEPSIKTVRKILKKIDEGAYTAPHVQRAQLEHYLERYPEAQLGDVYKWCFQDAYGPGHLVSDTARCKQNILDELSYLSASDGNPYYEPTGTRGNYIRVNLALVRDGVISIDTLAGLVMASAQQAQMPTLEGWGSCWQGIMEEIALMEKKPGNFEADSLDIEKIFSLGHYVMHHSEHFNESYNFHYRLVSRDLFYKRLYPKMPLKYRMPKSVEEDSTDEKN